MRVAALYDVHGNLPALEAVLADLERETFDLVLVGGDAVLGPQPADSLERLFALGEQARFIRGNTERALVEPPEGDPWLARLLWVRERLSDEQRALLAELPLTLSLEVDGLGPTLFCHGSPRSDEEIVTRVTPAKRLNEVLRTVEEAVVVCGHTHVQYDRLVGATRLVNAGSVGMPYEGEPGIACWALLGPDVALRRSGYDVEDAARRIRASGYPDAEEFVQEYLLHPTSADEATEHFERLAI